MKKIVTIRPLKEPERYRAFYEAMINGSEIEGGYISCRSECHEAGEKIAKFTLRPSAPLPHDKG